MRASREKIQQEFAEPTRATRTKAALLYIVGAAVWIFTEFFYDPVIVSRLQGPLCETLPWTQRLVAGLLLLFVLASAMAVRAAWLTLASGQTPFPGAWLVFRKPIRRGWRAKVDGLAYLLMAGAIWAFILWMWSFLHLPVIFCLTGECPPC